jgi:hypothetical protein
VVWNIPVIGERALDGAAMFLCILAYPDDEERRRETFGATLAHRIRRHREHNKVMGCAVRGAVPDPRAQVALARWPARKMWGTLGALNKQLIDRLRYAELLNYFGRIAFAKPQRIKVGRYPTIRQPSQRLTVTENSARLEDDPATPRFPTTASDLVKIGAQRWNMEPGNVRKNIVTPGKTVAHLAIALQEINLARNASRGARPGDVEHDEDDLLAYLLACPQWVLAALEDAQKLAQHWSANAAAFPSWRSVDPSTFIELQPVVD